MAQLHHCPLGSVSCSQVHSVVAGHFSTKPVSTKGCWCWKSLSKSSKEKLLKSTSTQNVLSKSFFDVSSSEMTSFPPPTWAMWTTSWSEMIWIPILASRIKVMFHAAQLRQAKKSLWDYPPLLTLTCKGRLQTCSIDKEVQRLHEYSWPMSTSIMFFVDLSSSSNSNHFLTLSMCRGTILYYTCDQGLRPAEAYSHRSTPQNSPCSRKTSLSSQILLQELRAQPHVLLSRGQLHGEGNAGCDHVQRDGTIARRTSSSVPMVAMPCRLLSYQMPRPKPPAARLWHRLALQPLEQHEEASNRGKPTYANVKYEVVLIPS